VQQVGFIYKIIRGKKKKKTKIHLFCLSLYKYELYFTVLLLFLIVHGDDPIRCMCLKRPVYFDLFLIFFIFLCV
jgi:hypothetical protein